MIATATIIALTVAVVTLIVRDRRREVREAGQRAVIAQQAATIMRERRGNVVPLRDSDADGRIAAILAHNEAQRADWREPGGWR